MEILDQGCSQLEVQVLQYSLIFTHTELYSTVCHSKPFLGDAVPGGLSLSRCMDLQVSRQTHSGRMIPHLERSGMSNSTRIVYPRDGKLLFCD